MLNVHACAAADRYCSNLRCVATFHRMEGFEAVSLRLLAQATAGRIIAGSLLQCGIHVGALTPLIQLCSALTMSDAK